MQRAIAHDVQAQALDAEGIGTRCAGARDAHAEGEHLRAEPVQRRVEVQTGDADRIGGQHAVLAMAMAHRQRGAVDHQHLQVCHADGLALFGLLDRGRGFEQRHREQRQFRLRRPRLALHLGEVDHARAVVQAQLQAVVVHARTRVGRAQDAGQRGVVAGQRDAWAQQHGSGEQQTRQQGMRHRILPEMGEICRRSPSAASGS
ncbi:hypothetical protein EER27_07600 [Lysobacter psychrotolerans]|uniref:Uncharacterized protein n=1 Tax=Montanilutibacter psychrotolerans TaxID=1327343 RepID=A0A3M8SSE4_9GAMM|nr:hypothetical protein EER27_07600 [Lysobacter psychrotolerans]